MTINQLIKRLENARQDKFIGGNATVVFPKEVVEDDLDSYENYYRVESVSQIEYRGTVYLRLDGYGREFTS